MPKDYSTYMRVKLSPSQATVMLVNLQNKREDAANAAVLPDSIWVEFECIRFDAELAEGHNHSAQAHLTHKDGTPL